MLELSAMWKMEIECLKKAEKKLTTHLANNAVVDFVVFAYIPAADVILDAVAVDAAEASAH